MPVLAVYVCLLVCVVGKLSSETAMAHPSDGVSLYFIHQRSQDLEAVKPAVEIARLIFLTLGCMINKLLIDCRFTSSVTSSKNIVKSTCHYLLLCVRKST